MQSPSSPAAALPSGLLCVGKMRISNEFCIVSLTPEPHRVTRAWTVIPKAQGNFYNQVFKTHQPAESQNLSSGGVRIVALCQMESCGGWGRTTLYQRFQK